MRRRRSIVGILLAIAGAAAADEPDQALISYEASIGGAKRISGVARSMEWSATAMTERSVAVQLRVPIASFDSGHPEFDSLLRAAMQAELYPFVEIEGIARGKRFEGTLRLHGVSRPLNVDITVDRAGGRLIASSSFFIELDDFGVSLPAVASRVAVEFLARISASPLAVVSGGAVSSTN